MKQKMTMDEDASPFWIYLRPIAILSNAFGCYCQPLKKCRVFGSISIVYAILVSVLLLYTIYRCCTPLFSGGLQWNTVTLFKFFFINYFVLGLMSQLFTVFAGSAVMKVVQALQGTAKKLTKKNEKALKKISIFGILSVIFKIVTGYTTVVICTIGIVTVAYIPDFLPGGPKFLVLIPALYCQTAACVAMGLFAVLCGIVRISLMSISSEMEQSSAETLQELQQRYQRMVTATRAVDGYFSNYVILYYALTLPLICVTLFALIRGDGFEIASKAVLILWVTIMAANLVLVSVPAIQLYEEGQRTLDALFKLYNQKMAGANLLHLHQVQIFIEQVTHSNIGISGGGFFTITRSLLLTIVSAIVTYFLIILQFAVDQNCNYPAPFVQNVTKS